jgi:hypothetical protein
VQYEDDYGVHTRQETLQMTVIDGDSTGLIMVIILLIIGAGAAYWYFVIRKKGTGDV